MSVPADLFANPYSSPAEAPLVAQVVDDSPKPGSVGMILGGLVLLLVGYLASNLLAIAELYGLGTGTNGDQMPSPLAGVLTSQAQKWLFYLLSASAFVAGAVMLGSQRSNPITMVCYIMCPLAAVAFAVGWPLRAVRRFAEPLAAIYLLVGSSLAFTGGMRLLTLYGNSRGSFEPVLASFITEVGVALAIGALLKFWSGSQAATPPATVLVP